MNKYFSKLTRKYNQIKISKRLLIHAYKIMIEQELIEYNDDFMTLLRHRPIRTNSGVSSFAIMLSPYPEYYDPEQNKFIRQDCSCKHNCKFCPTIPDFPSYVPGEPGVDEVKRMIGFRINNLMLDLNVLILVVMVAKLNLFLRKLPTNFPKPYLIDFHTVLHSKYMGSS